MANTDISNPMGVTDKRVGRGVTGANIHAEIGNMTSISGMRARLTALKPGSYTAVRLDTMTENDMIYALRTESGDSAGI